jgi:Domain of unknown function (DUF4124)
MPRIRHRRSLRGARWPLVAAFALALAPHAVAEIYKCTDHAGNITYQNEKCPGGGKAERVDVFDNNWTASRTEKDAQWQRTAADHRVVTGMPSHWVREGFGDPADIRETTTGGARELWVYNFSDRNLQIGMADDQVVWFRETPVLAPATRVAPMPEKAAAAAARVPPSPEAPRPIDILRAPELPGPADAQPAADAPPATQVRRAPEAPRAAEPPRASGAAQQAALSPAVEPQKRIVRGRDCREVLAELGTPDRQRDLPASEALGTGAMTEYLYEPGGTGDPARTRILCANGKVEGVDRSVAR